jgi:fatty-acyl-CoA synthase
MMDLPLSLNHVLERAAGSFPERDRLASARQVAGPAHLCRVLPTHPRLASALLAAGLRKGDRVATLCWNHHAHLEAYFGIPAAGGVMHTLNLRLSPDEIGWIAGHANDRFLILDDVLLPLYEQFKALHRFEKVIVFRFGGSAVPDGMVDYEQFLADAPADFTYPAHDERDPSSMCYTSGTTGKPKGVVYRIVPRCCTPCPCLAPDDGPASTDVVLPVTPMFHANAWGVPYAAIMVGAKFVFPGRICMPKTCWISSSSSRPRCRWVCRRSG